MPVMMPMLKIDYRKLISRADLVYSKPAKDSQAGQPVGNGRMGSLVWTSSQGLRFQINRADIFASNSDSDSFYKSHSDYCCGAGFVDIDFGGREEVFTERCFRQHLSCYDATIVTEGNGVKADACAWSEGDVLAVRIEDSRTSQGRMSVSLRALRPPVVKRDSHSAVSRVQVVRDTIVLTQEFTEKSFCCRSALAVAMPGSDPAGSIVSDGQVTLSAGRAQRNVTLLISSAATFDPAVDVVEEALRQLDQAGSAGVEGMLHATKAWWHAFWEKAFVSLHSRDGKADAVERQYTYYLYLMAATSRGRYPAKFNGMLWNTGGDRRQWGANYWGANQSCLHNALFAANRIELMEPTFAMLSGSRESYERAARQEWGSEGMYIPETVGFDGVPALPESIAAEMRDLYLVRKPWTGKSDEFREYARGKHPHLSRWNWKKDSKDANGMWHYADLGTGPFSWVNHLFSRGAMIAYQFYWRRYECTCDREWLAEQAYPVIRGIAEFYRTFPNVKKEADGKYHIHYVNDNEPVWGGHNTVHEIASMMGIFPVAIKASEILGVDAELRPVWREFLANLSPLPLSSDHPELAGTPLRFVSSLKPAVGGPSPVTDLPDLNTQPIACFDLVSLECTDHERMGIANATFDAHFPEGMAGAEVGCLCLLPVTGALLGRREATRHLIPKQVSSSDAMENRMDTREGVQTTNAEGLGRAAEALQIALCQSVPPSPGGQAVIRVFPAWPEDWDAQFRLLCRGNFLVTSSLREGVIEFVEIESRAGSECLIRNPWGDGRVDICRDGEHWKTFTGNLISFETARGERFVLTRKPGGSLIMQGSPSAPYHDSRECFDKRFRAQARQMCMRASTPAAALAWGKAARKQLTALLGLQRMTGTAPHSRMTESVDCGDHVREHWLMETERYVTMPFYLLRPKGLAGPLPAVLCPHGHCGGGKAAVAGVDADPAVAASIREYNYDYGLQFARAGLLAFCPDARGFGERQEIEVRSDRMTSSCQHLQMMGGPLGIPVAGMWTFDLIRLMDHVQRRSDVLGGRVGCAGLSGGGLQTLYFSAVDTRVACAVVSGYFYGAREALLQMPMNCPCNMIPHMWEYFDQGDVGAMIAPRPLLIETGNTDNLNGASGTENVVTQIKIAGKAYKLLGARDRLRHDIFEGPHKWHGVESIPWMVKWLTAGR